MQKIKEFATNKLAELFADGYKLLLGTDGLYNTNQISVKLEKDGERYLFAVENSFDCFDRHCIDIVTVALRRLVRGFPEREALFAKEYYRMSRDKWENLYYTEDKQAAMDAEEKRYNRAVNKYESNNKGFKCTNNKVLDKVRAHKGFKRAKEVVIKRVCYKDYYGYHNRYEVSFGDKSYDVKIKGVAC